MPFLRVIRDKRGYETTYLMHWYREGSKQRSRILYAFRTPGGVRVGRTALEPEVQRQVQARYPDIEFDWKAVLDNQQVIESAPEQRRPRKRRRSDEETPAAAAVAAAVPAAAPEAPAPAPQEPPRPRIPSAIEGATDDEKMAFLRLWYDRVRERIPQRTSDPVRVEALLALAERLNPEGWSDPEQVAGGLQHAAEALERLSRVFTKRRRRTRKPKPARPDAAPPDPAPADAAPPEPSAGPDSSDE